MKWSLIPVLGVLAFGMNACEKKPAAQLPPEHATAFGEHAWKPGDAGHGAGHKEEHAPAAAHSPEAHAAPVAEGKPGEAPSMFPVKK